MTIRIANDVEKKNRQDLLTCNFDNGVKTSNDSDTDSVPLVINWHTRFKGLASILHRIYQTMLEGRPKLAKIFPK